MTATYEPLRIGPDFMLPVDFTTQASAILAKRRAGKSNLGVVIVEELHKQGIVWCAIDPKGDWWGTTFAGDGKGPGLDVPIFGGLHGDVALEPTSGRVIARLVAEQHVSCLVDVSQFIRPDMFRFLYDFAVELLRLNTTPVLVVAEECDVYLPQNLKKEGGYAPKCLGAWQRLVKQGGQKGLGSLQISQRAASVSWDTLSQIDNLFTLQLTAANDIKVAKDWVVGQYSKPDEEQRELLASLPSLKPGTGYFYSPSTLEILTPFTARRRWTFDSGRTPKVGEKVIVPTGRAAINLEALGAEIAATVEKAKAEDPAELRKRITELEATLITARGQAPGVLEVPVPYVPATIVDASGTFHEALGIAVSAIANAVKVLHEEVMPKAAREIGDALDGLDKAIAEAQEAASTSTPGPVPSPTSPAPPARPPAPAGDGGDLEGMQPTERRMLEELARFHPRVLTEKQLAAALDRKSTSGGWKGAKAQLRRDGLIEYENRCLVLTDAGVARVGSIEPVPAGGPALVTYWNARLDPTARVLLAELLRLPPDADVTFDALCNLADRVATSGASKGAIAQLVRLGLVDRKNGVLRADAKLR